MANSTNTVLIADDDGVVRQILADLLTEQGYRVALAADGDETWSKLQEHEPEYLLLDWLMPGFSGPEICRRVRERGGSHYTYVILITASATDRRVEEALYSGADDFLTKPVRPSELLARMRAGQRVLDLESRLQLQATVDSLTGLANRRYFMSQFEREWARSVRHATPLSCVVFDLDFFKRINDQHGHQAGDQALCHFAQLLGDNRRAHDHIGRMGGEEFGALLPETDEQGASRWADRIRATLADQAAQLAGLELRLSVSAGVAARRGQSRVEDLVDQADQALLLAKRTGRNRVATATELEEGKGNGVGFAELELPLAGLTAADLMTAPIVCLNEQQSAVEAAGLLLRNRWSSVPVVNREGLLTGILSEKDLLPLMTNHRLAQVQVAELMSRQVVTFAEQTPASAVLDFLYRVAIRRVVVVRAGKPVGVVSRGNLLRQFESWKVHREAALV